jgi:replicative DNA helicase
LTDPKISASQAAADMRQELDRMHSAIDDASESQEDGDDDAAWEEVAERANRLFMDGGESAEGVRTHIPELDAILPAMREGNLIILAGLPGHGKTTLALQTGINNALAGVPVLFVTLEMSKDEIRQKLASMVSGVPEFVIDNGSGTESQMAAYLDAARKLQAAPLKIVRKLPMKPSALFSIARRWHRKTGDSKQKLVVIDYLGKMEPDSSTRGVYERMTALSGDMKNIAGMLGLPVLTLAQINREIFKRSNKKPQNADLRDSGNLEADADLILFVQKAQGMIELEEPIPGSEDYFEQHAAWSARHQAAAGLTSVYLTKSRRTGVTGTAELRFKNGKFSTETAKSAHAF